MPRMFTWRAGRCRIVSVHLGTRASFEMRLWSRPPRTHPAAIDDMSWPTR